MKGGIPLEKLEKLRTLLHIAIDRNKKEEILKLSRELDKLIVKEMRALYLNKDARKVNIYA